MKHAAVGSAGMTLVEVLVAVLTFLVVVVGLASSVTSARRTELSSRQIAEATTLAVDKLEHLRTLLLLHPEIAPGSHQDPANPLHGNGATGGIYTRTWTVTQNLPILGMRQVRMTVSWNDHGRPANVTLHSYLSLL
jgi:Tfp pilus assembly protein PilV